MHGDSLRRADIVDDAAVLLEALADGLHSDDLTVISSRGEGVDSAMDALDSVPASAVAAIDTSMQTDAYNPNELWRDEDLDAPERAEAVDGDDAQNDAAHRAEAAALDTEDLSSLRPSTSDGGGSGISQGEDEGTSPEDEAQRAARAALQRWKSSDSE